jgi:hypothetical protein
MTNDLLTTDSATLASLAEGLKADAKAIANVNRPEAMRLFRLWRAITAELSRRYALSILPRSQSYRWN